jgi:hypothetical protein
MAAYTDYRLGSEITVENVAWTITDIQDRDAGKYKTRVFTLKNPAGETITKTSRGITVWAGGSDVAVAVADNEPAAAEPAGDSDSSGDLAAEIAAVIGKRLGKGGISREQVIEIVDDRLAAVYLPQRVEVSVGGLPPTDVGVQHASFEALLRIVATRKNVWLFGPAGSGKTSAAHAVSKALGLPFFAKSVGPQTSEASLLGYHDANGNVVRTQLREAYENGGVFLLDEIDSANPAVLVVINALLANGHASFPDCVVEKHADFVLLAGANTIGQGADRQYVGRQQIDAATLDRFVYVQWDYDPAIEAAAAGVPLSAVHGAKAPKRFKFVDDSGAEQRCAEWVAKVVKVRGIVDSFGKAVRFVVSPRASIHGVALLRAGFKPDDVAELCLWKGLDSDTRTKIEAKL